MFWVKYFFASLALMLFAGLSCHSLADGNYVGTETCGYCHTHEYENFISYSKKANSWENISVMAPKLTRQELEGCYGCHTTGYNQGGFISHELTPELSDVGCETCHGPGKEHSDTGYPDAIIRLPSMSDCLNCHTDERNEAFNFRPLIYSGAH